MKKLLIFLTMVLISQSVFAQVGIFRSYKDLKNNKVEAYDGPVKILHVGGRFKISVKDKNGKRVKVKVDKSDFWGFRDEDDYIYRVNEKNHPYKIIELGKLLVYTSYSTKIRKDGTIMFVVNQFVPHFSKGPNGKMIPLTKRNLLKYLGNDKKELNDFIEQRIGRLEDLYNFIVEYNLRYQKKKAK